MDVIQRRIFVEWRYEKQPPGYAEIEVALDQLEQRGLLHSKFLVSCMPLEHGRPVLTENQARPNVTTDKRSGVP